MSFESFREPARALELTQPYSPEQVAELVRKYDACIIQAVHDVAVNGQTTGQFASGQWRQTNRLGKQQPVFIMEFDFPDIARLPLVFRPTRLAFKDHYQEIEAVQRHFPRLYTCTEVSGDDGSSWQVLVVEKIEGFHGDSVSDEDVAAFFGHLEDSDNFEKLCQDMFQAVDEVFAEPLDIQDVRPVTGHNVIYNVKTEHF